MIIDDTHYDVIIIGSGAAGGTLAGRLAGRGRRVLLLERGGQLPLVDQNVADVDLFRKDRYHPARETWMGPDADPFAPQTIYAPVPYNPLTLPNNKKGVEHVDQW